MADYKQVKNVAVKVIEKAFIGGKIIEAGGIVEDYTGGLSANLELVKAEKPKAEK